jgi:hypothetical protein
LREGPAQENEHQRGGKYRQPKEYLFLHIKSPFNIPE